MSNRDTSSSLQWLSSLSTSFNPFRDADKHLRKTSIIGTIGPSIDSVDKVSALMDAGMTIVRINFSHGSHETHQTEIDMIRAAVKADPKSRPLAIAIDTKGAGIRGGWMTDNEPVPIWQGHEFYLTVDPTYARAGTKDILYIDYADLVNASSPGSKVYFDDGRLSLEVLSVEGNKMRVRAMNAGVLASKKGINLPGTVVDLPALSDQDRSDIDFGIKNGIDIVFASCMRSADDVHTVRSALGAAGKKIKVIAKIENEQGVEHFDEILAVTDGVMVARGDLGIEIPTSQVFMAQKKMIAKANVVGKPAIVATQMLDSMTLNPRPTRAEVSDVANAILDGADAVMLSAETAIGKYPREAVLMMAETCFLAETSVCHAPLFNDIRDLTPQPTSTNETIAVAAVSAVMEQDAAALLVLTTSGTSAALLSKYRPPVPILTVTRSAATARQLNLHRGAYTFWYPEPTIAEDSTEWQVDVDNRIRFGLKAALELQMIKPGQTVVAIQGWKRGEGHTNTLRILSVPTDFEDLTLAPVS